LEGWLVICWLGSIGILRCGFNRTRRCRRRWQREFLLETRDNKKLCARLTNGMLNESLGRQCRTLFHPTFGYTLGRPRSIIMQCSSVSLACSSPSTPASCVKSVWSGDQCPISSCSCMECMHRVPYFHLILVGL
jgi:hypothetical protein